MQRHFDGVTFLSGCKDRLKNIENTKALPLFSGLAVSFLAALSHELISDRRSKRYNDILSFAFWIRRATLERERERYPDAKLRMGRGIAFHIAPSNVPVNFAVSFTSCLLAGNACIVRVSEKHYEQVDIICDAINKLTAEDFPRISDYLFIIRYPRESEFTAYFSSICDIRIVWGGDSTIFAIREAPLPPRAIDLAFADRFSLAIINSDSYLDADCDEVARGFYVDTYYTDQGACSSPSLVVWTGSRVAEARRVFWDKLGALVKAQYDMLPVQAVDKLCAFCSLAALSDKVLLQSIDNYIVRILLETLPTDLSDYKCAGGFFFEYITDDLTQIIPVLGKSCQTVSYCGINNDELLCLVTEHGVRGVDRIVPIGKTMELSFTWDGYDMIEAMSRIIDCF